MAPLRSAVMETLVAVVAKKAGASSLDADAVGRRPLCFEVELCEGCLAVTLARLFASNGFTGWLAVCAPTFLSLQVASRSSFAGEAWRLALVALDVHVCSLFVLASRFLAAMSVTSLAPGHCSECGSSFLFVLTFFELGFCRGVLQVVDRTSLWPFELLVSLPRSALALASPLFGAGS